MPGIGVEIGENPFAACDTPDDLTSALAQFSEDLGLPFFSYLMIQNRTDQSAAHQDFFLTNYDEAWCERYIQKFYKHYDPVALVSKRSRLPFFWNSKAFLRPFRKDQKRVFHEGRSFSIVAGYSVPISGPNGDIGVYSVAASQEGHLVDAVRGATAKILMAAIQAHDRAVTLNCFDAVERETPVLQARELECLKWTADGKTSEEIGEIISVSPATVVYHLNKSIRKLNANNRYHAAVKAVRLSLI